MTTQGRITQRSIAQLKEAIDIRSLISEQVKLKSAGGDSFKGLCPFHKEKTPSFTVTPSKGFYHCFGCKASGDAIKFVRETRNLDYVSAITELAQRFGVALEYEQRSSRSQAADRQYQKAQSAAHSLLDEICTYYEQQLSTSTQVQKYLQGRGITATEAYNYRLGFAPKGGLEKHFGDKTSELTKVGALSKDKGYDMMSGRLTFPIVGRSGNILGFGGRILQGKGPKYINYGETEFFHKGRELYGLHEALNLNPRPKTLLLVEGYMDAIAAARPAREDSQLPLASRSAGHSTHAAPCSANAAQFLKAGAVF